MLLNGDSACLAGQPFQCEQAGDHKWKDPIQRIVYRMGVAVHGDKYSNAKCQNEEIRDPALNRYRTVKPAHRDKPLFFSRVLQSIAEKFKAAFNS